MEHKWQDSIIGRGRHSLGWTYIMVFEITKICKISQKVSTKRKEKKIKSWAASTFTWLVQES